MPSPSALRAYSYLILTASIWGSIYVVSRIALETIPPLTILFSRYLFAAMALFLFTAFRRGGPLASIARKDWKYVAFIGGVGYFLSVGLQLFGMKFAGASVASLINALNPVCIILFAVLLLKEKLTAAKVVALVAAVSGACLILGYSTGGAVWGILFSLGSVVLWAFTAVFVRRVSQRYDPLVLTAWACAVACIPLFPASILELSTVAHGALFSVKNLVCLLYLGLVGTALANVLWNTSLSMIEASYCSLFYPIQPLVTVILGILVLDERVGPTFFAGACLILGGLGYGIFPRKRLG